MTSYTYDANGNMTYIPFNKTLTWDAENRLIRWTNPYGSYYFTYDGDGKRVKQAQDIGSPDEILYVNKYFERNLTTSENTSYYYLGNRLVLPRPSITLISSLPSTGKTITDAMILLSATALWLNLVE